MYWASLVLFGVCRLWEIQVHALIQETKRILMLLKIPSTVNQSSRQNKHNLNINVLPTSLTLPDTETMSSIICDPCVTVRCKSRPAQTSKITNSHNWVEHDFPSFSFDDNMFDVGMGNSIHFDLDIPSLPDGTSPDMIASPPLRTIGFTKDVTPSYNRHDIVLSRQHRENLEQHNRLQAPLPPMPRKSRANKRKCQCDRSIGYYEHEWNELCMSFQTRQRQPRCWYSRWRLIWPKSPVKRLCMYTNEALAPLWNYCVGSHIDILEQHFQNQTVVCRNQYAEKQWEIWNKDQRRELVQSTSADVPDLDDYSFEIGRADCVRDAPTTTDDLFPWSRMGEWRIDILEDIGNDSVSSANTSIVQQAARWTSPNISSDSFDRRLSQFSRTFDSKNAESPPIFSPVLRQGNYTSMNAAEKEGFDGSSRLQVQCINTHTHTQYRKMTIIYSIRSMCKATLMISFCAFW